MPFQFQATPGRKRQPFTAAHRANMSAARIGKRHSPEARAKMIASAKRRGTPWLIDPDRDAVRRRSLIAQRMHSRVFRLMEAIRAGRLKATRIGYTSDDLRRHIEALFRDGMTWANYGVDWEIDHVRPICHFVDCGITDPRVINALSNLQPLWCAENHEKMRKYEGAA